MVEKVITNLDSSQASDPGCIPVVVLKSCEPEFLYIPAELFNMCLKESCFPDCWKISLVVPVGKMSTAKNYHTVSLLSVVSKVFEKLINNKIFNHLITCGLFSDFQYGFRSSWSIADLLTVASHRIAGANRSGTTWAGHLVYPRLVTEAFYKAFDKVDLWQQLELASELESDLLDPVDRGWKWLVDFNAGKPQLVLFDQSDNTGAIDA